MMEMRIEKKQKGRRKRKRKDIPPQKNPFS